MIIFGTIMTFVVGIIFCCAAHPDNSPVLWVRALWGGLGMALVFAAAANFVAMMFGAYA